ncbi:HAUS augmin-like complex subunit 1 [Gadus morhua]|uniref:HAUS augmin-like complex subunit 1 n=1 Tax=Gadus morhua TaxID=8049 RepID=A0A8C5F8G7_GADMO|nr:HAUS augmin-like complex subunit 1 [Gadus morhua]XP_056450632.1 HAUS augmin-like complex subunit 1 [Gadus chalcogrammus]XP_059913377.1 HAUS augmin-like complex subunit 1 [Gadus macrocephalus]
MCEKMRKVQTWLSTAMGEQPIPQFEVNTRTVDILYQLAVASEVRCKDTSLLIDDFKQKGSEYDADSIHLQEVLLQGVGLSCGGLSKPAGDYMSALVDNAMVLGVRDTSLGSFVPAVNKLTNDVLEAEKSDERLDQEMKALRKKLGATLVLRKNLQEDINKTVKDQAVGGAQAEERLLNMDFVKTKSRELINRRKIAEDQISSRNMNKKFSHQALMEIFEEVNTLRHEIIPLTKKLEPYLDLSPSPSLAQVKVEEAKRELAAIDAKLEVNMDFMQK